MSNLGKGWFKGGTSKAADGPSEADERLAFIQKRLGRRQKDATSAADTVERTETRASDRLVPDRSATVLELRNGKKVAARVINVSDEAVAVEPDVSTLDPAMVVKIGQRKVQPGRRMARGLVFLFEKPLNLARTGPNVFDQDWKAK